ncbi:hypothetical protein [Streptomyces sp. NPDC012466]|uniref:hypothetical protein n=1 Tax=Streptomyces sp. NPDC012466 TaxID=3364835 RepID=UPI0036EB09D8
MIRDPAVGAFRLCSPDKTASNRLCLTDAETGQDALLATYEAFAAVNTSLLVQHLKHRSVRTATGAAELPRGG